MRFTRYPGGFLGTLAVLGVLSCVVSTGGQLPPPEPGNDPGYIVHYDGGVTSPWQMPYSEDQNGYGGSTNSWSSSESCSGTINVTLEWDDAGDPDNNPPPKG